MQDSKKFIERVTDLVNKAKKNNNTITIDEIKEEFHDISFNEDQFEPIYVYLAENKITIKNYIPKEPREYSGSPESNEESAFVAMYLDDISSIKECDEEEFITLPKRIQAGEEEARTRLIEGSLKAVINIAKEYKGMGIPTSDLIQEGNIGLMDAVSSLNIRRDSLDSLNVKEYLEESIHRFIKIAIEDQYSESKTGKEVINKVSQISKSAKELEEVLGRHPSVTEVAEFLKLTPEEIEDILHLSKDILEEGHHH